MPLCLIPEQEDDTLQKYRHITTVDEEVFHYVDYIHLGLWSIRILFIAFILPMILLPLVPNAGPDFPSSLIGCDFLVAAVVTAVICVWYGLTKPIKGEFSAAILFLIMLGASFMAFHPTKPAPESSLSSLNESEARNRVLDTVKVDIEGRPNIVNPTLYTLSNITLECTHWPAADTPSDVYDSLSTKEEISIKTTVLPYSHVYLDSDALDGLKTRYRTTCDLKNFYMQTGNSQ